MSFKDYCEKYENELEDAWVESMRDGTKEAFIFKCYKEWMNGDDE